MIERPSYLLPLKNGFALIDADDLNLVKDYIWYSCQYGRKFYVKAASRNGKFDKSIYLHRLLLNAPKGKFVDHINHDGLDNRKCNIRICSRSQNAGNCRKFKSLKNTSKYKGVSWMTSHKSWVVQLTGIRRSSTFIGYFKNEDEAAIAYNKAAKEYFGEYALLNEINNND